MAHKGHANFKKLDTTFKKVDANFKKLMQK